MKRKRGNPNWIEAGWGEETKAFKIPLRIGQWLQTLKKEGVSAEDILALLD
jgi:hypothetical protein